MRTVKNNVELPLRSAPFPRILSSSRRVSFGIVPAEDRKEEPRNGGGERRPRKEEPRGGAGEEKN